MKERTLLIFTVIINLALAMIAGVAPAVADSVRVFLKPSFLEISEGEKFELYVNIDPSEHGISVCDILIGFDKEALVVSKVLDGELLGSSPLVLKKEIDNETGTVWYIAARVGVTNPPTPPGTLIKIEFKTKENIKSGTYHIRILRVKIADEHIEAITETILENSTIRVSGKTVTTEATITYPSTVFTYTTSSIFYPSYAYTSTFITTMSSNHYMLILLVSTIILFTVVILSLLMIILILTKRRRRKPRIVRVQG